MLDQVAGGEFAWFREAMSLPPEPSSDRQASELTIVGAAPSWFDGHSMPANTHFVQPMEPDPAPGESIEELARRRRPATVGVRDVRNGVQYARTVPVGLRRRRRPRCPSHRHDRNEQRNRRPDDPRKCSNGSVPLPGSHPGACRCGRRSWRLRLADGSAQARTSRLELAARSARQPVQCSPVGDARRRTRPRRGRANPRGHPTIPSPAARAPGVPRPRR